MVVWGLELSIQAMAQHVRPEYAPPGDFLWLLQTRFERLDPWIGKSPAALRAQSADDGDAERFAHTPVAENGSHRATESVKPRV